MPTDPEPAHTNGPLHFTESVQSAESSSSGPILSACVYPPSLSLTISSALREAAQLNREGTHALASGNIRAAMIAFRTALVVMECTSPHVQRPPDYSDTLDGNPQLHAVCIPFQDDYLYIFNSAFDFNPSVQGELREEHFKFQVPFYSAMILFNQALCLHTRGMQSEDDHALRYSVQFYDMAMETLSTIPINHYSDPLMLFMLSIWNNQAQIYYSLRQYKHAMKISEGVRKLSARMLLDPRSGLSEDEQKHVFEFVLNVIVMKEPATAPCA